MNIIFSHNTLQFLPKFEREIKLNYFKEKLVNELFILGQLIDIECSTNSKKLYTFEAMQVNFNSNFVILELKNIIE